MLWHGALSFPAEDKRVGTFRGAPPRESNGRRRRKKTGGT